MLKVKFKREKNHPLWKSFYHAFEGIKECLVTERNMTIHFCFMIAVIILVFVLNISLKEWFVCIILFALVISLELVNTAIETTIDICSPTINDKAKLAKDTAAGAVLVAAIASSIIGLIIFVPKIIDVINRMLQL